MPGPRCVVALLIAATSLSGCIGPSDEDRARDAAVERVEAIGAPDGYRQASIVTREIDTGAFTRQPGSVVVELAPIEEGTLSVRVIDEFMVGQGYRRYSNKVCLDLGLYSLDYVRADIQVSVVMRDADDTASMTHSFTSSLEAPSPPVVRDEVLELPDCSGATR